MPPEAAPGASPDFDPGADADATRAPGPPYSMEAEQAVLGGLLMDGEAWDKVADLIQRDDFYVRAHRVLFGAIGDLVQRDSPCDAVTVGEQLKAAPDGGADGALAYLSTLIEETPGSANIRHYAEIVRQHAVRRRLIAAANDTIEAAHRAARRDAADLLDEAEQRFFEIGDRHARVTDFRSLKELSREAYNYVDEMRERGETVTGLRTGFNEFDEKTSGLQQGDLLVIAGRPSMGKTSLALNIVEHVAIAEKKGAVALFSMEMSAAQLALRFCSSLGHIDQLNLRTGQLRDDEWPRLTNAMTMLNEAEDVYIDDTSNLSPTMVRAKTRRLQRRCGRLALVVVDYLQLMKVQGDVENRVLEIAEISRGLKSLARELDAPVIALSQLNRSLEQRSDKRPIMSDLRESGAIEQDADLIVFIYRDEVYDENSPDKNTAEIRVAKQRNGPQFMTRLTFRKQYTRFENHVPEAAAYAGDYAPSAGATPEDYGAP